MTIVQSSIKNILLIKFRGIGDVILSTVVLENLKNNFPNASIDFLTEKPSDQLLNLLDEINEVHLFSEKNLSGRLKLIRKIRKEKYDLIFDFYANPFTAQITFLSGAKYKAGFPYRGRKYAYNLFGPEERGKFHAAELHLKFLKKLGLSVTSNTLKLSLDNDSTKFAEEFFNKTFSQNNFVIGISPSGGWESKKCNPIKFAEIADAASQKYNAKIMIVWGPGDELETDDIIRFMKTEAIKAPPTNIKQMAALISRCKILIANDSGPMHISTALGTPTLSLHGPTDPKLQGPYGSKHVWINKSDLHCIICNKLVCPYNHECFLELDVDDIIAKVDKLIEKNNITL